MTFKKGSNYGGLEFSKENQPAKNGRPKGPSRSTIARKVLAMKGKLPTEMYEALQAIFPGIKEKMSFEEMGTIAMAANMVKGDVASYKALMDSAHGAPKQDIELAGKDGGAIEQTLTVTVVAAPSPLANSEAEVLDRLKK